MAKLMKIKVCLDQPDNKLSSDKKLGMILYLPIDRLAENTPFEEVIFKFFYTV